MHYTDLAIIELPLYVCGLSAGLNRSFYEIIKFGRVVSFKWSVRI